jgi:RNA polymerase sigma factor for flagellar operon FliA
MSEVWEDKRVPAEGGVRARNQQRSYVDRVAARAARPSPRPPVTLPRVAGWPVPPSGTAAQPA